MIDPDKMSDYILPGNTPGVYLVKQPTKFCEVHGEVSQWLGFNFVNGGAPSVHFCAECLTALISKHIQPLKDAAP